MDKTDNTKSITISFSFEPGEESQVAIMMERMAFMIRDKANGEPA